LKAAEQALIVFQAGHRASRPRDLLNSAQAGQQGAGVGSIHRHTPNNSSLSASSVLIRPTESTQDSLLPGAAGPSVPPDRWEGMDLDRCADGSTDEPVRFLLHDVSGMEQSACRQRSLRGQKRTFSLAKPIGGKRAVPGYTQSAAIRGELPCSGSLVERQHLRTNPVAEVLSRYAVIAVENAAGVRKRGMLRGLPWISLTLSSLQRSLQ